MPEGKELPTVFEKTIELSARLKVLYAVISLLVLLGCFAYYLSAGQSGIVPCIWILASWMCGLLMIPRMKVSKVYSDGFSLVISFADGKIESIPWSDVQDVRQITRWPLAAWINPIGGPISGLEISTNSRTIVLDEFFAWDKEFVKKMTNHPILIHNKDENQSPDSD